MIYDPDSTLFSYNSDTEPGVRSSDVKAATAANKKPSNMTQVKDSPTVVKVEGMAYTVFC